MKYIAGVIMGGAAIAAASGAGAVSTPLCSSSPFAGTASLSADFSCVVDGNSTGNNGPANIADGLTAATGASFSVSGLTFYQGGFTLSDVAAPTQRTPYSATLTLDDPGMLFKIATVKAGHRFELLYFADGVSSAALQANYRNMGRQFPDLSHIALYNGFAAPLPPTDTPPTDTPPNGPPQDVPAPAGLALLGLGVLGVASRRRLS